MTQSPAYFKRWRLDREQGHLRYVDPEPVTRHVNRLLAAGMSGRGIALAAGVSPQTIGRFRDRGYERTQRATARRILAVRADAIYRRQDDAGFVPRVGSTRRIQALMALGWRHQDITAAMRIATRSQLVLHQPGQYITRATRDAILRAYDELSMRRGPSEKTRQRAIASGYAPPLAWDDDTIDDPYAVPEGAGYTTGPVIEKILELEQMGLRRDHIADRLGVTRDAVDMAISRAAKAAA